MRLNALLAHCKSNLSPVNVITQLSYGNEIDMAVAFHSRRDNH